MKELDINYVRSLFPAFSENELRGNAFFENAIKSSQNGQLFPAGSMSFWTLKKASIPCAMSKKWKSRIAYKKHWKFIGEFCHFQ